jgi:hypothetical protein
VAALQSVQPDVRVAVGGDFNVYPRPDDPFAPGHPLFPSDQLAALYEQGLHNLYDHVLAEVPVAAFSYEFQGQTQTLDQIFVTQSLWAELVEARYAHINADFPADYDGDLGRGASDHDPLVARFIQSGQPPTVQVTPSLLWPPNHKYVTVKVTVTDDIDPNPYAELLSVTSDEPDSGLGGGDLPNDIVIVNDFRIKLRAERWGQGDGRTYTLTYLVADDSGNVAVVSVEVIVPHDRGNPR